MSGYMVQRGFHNVGSVYPVMRHPHAGQKKCKAFDVCLESWGATQPDVTQYILPVL